MIDNIGVYQAAEVLIDQAETRASDMLARGELDGLAVWERILAAVRNLLRDRSGDPLHCGKIIRQC